MELDSKVIEFYEYFNYDLAGLIRSDSYNDSEWTVKILILLNYKKYFGVENINTFLYKKEMNRLLAVKSKEHLENELDNINDPEDQLILLKKKKANEILSKINYDLEDSHKSIHPELNPFDGLIEYLNAKINQVDIINGFEMEKSIDLELLEKINYRLALLYELGIIDLLQKRFEENGLSSSGKEFAKMLGYILNEGKSSVIKYLSNLNLNPKKSRIPKNKSEVFTLNAIKGMYRSMRDCNLQVKGNYDKINK